jgi:hypothetical protein
MQVHRDGILELSGMRRTVLRCNGRHRLTLLEGIPIEPRGNVSHLYECALNARGASSEQIETWRLKGSRPASSTRRADTGPSHTQDPAQILNLQTWALQMRGVHGSLVSVKHKKMRNGSAASSRSNHRNNPPVLAGGTTERKAA